VEFHNSLRLTVLTVCFPLHKEEKPKEYKHPVWKPRGSRSYEHTHRWLRFTAETMLKAVWSSKDSRVTTVLAVGFSLVTRRSSKRATAPWLEGVIKGHMETYTRLEKVRSAAAPVPMGTITPKNIPKFFVGLSKWLSSTVPPVCLYLYKEYL
jgi:hypothetical protein